MFRLRRKRRAQQHTRWLLDGVLMEEDAYSGIILTGSPSSGKTSTVARALRRAMLRLGFGGINMCAKGDEFDNLMRDAEPTGRADDVVEYSARSDECCDILTAELSAPGGSPASAAAYLELAAEMYTRRNSQHGSEDHFWVNMNGKAYRHAITACRMVYGRCSVAHVYRFFQDAPLSPEQVHSEHWRATSFVRQTLEAGREAGLLEHHEFALAYAFWVKEWAGLSDRTRGVCLAVATNTLDKFMAGDALRIVSSGNTTHGPADTLRGKILAPNFPVLQYKDFGAFFAACLKLGVQNEVLRRDLSGDMRPVFIFSDEAQFFMIPSVDMMVSTVARQYRLINVDIFQNLPMLYSALGGGQKAETEVDGWLSCHLNWIALANTCVRTGTYLSKLYGQSWLDIWTDSIPAAPPYSFSADLFGYSPPQGPSCSRTPHLMPDVQPEAFGRLHRTCVAEPWSDGYLFQGGRIFPDTGAPWTLRRFPYLAPGPLPKRAYRSLPDAAAATPTAPALDARR